jgi:NAD(P)-dependent dehydrogenase (short-subunit alcohol dehydrogenase family)
MAFNGKVIAITGGAQGIGLATAKLLASRGASLSIADSNPATLAQIEEDFKAKRWPIHTSSVDIRDDRKVNAWIEATVKSFGRLDGAVNAAGTVGKYHGQKPVAELDDEDWDLVLGVNVTGIFHHRLWSNLTSYTNVRFQYRDDALSPC